jgi:acetone carboxylase gamma subunit
MQQEDCIRVINGHEIFCNDMFKTTRRNITCTSKQFEEIVSKSNTTDKLEIHNLFCDNCDNLTDIEIVSVLGYY